MVGGGEGERGVGGHHSTLFYGAQMLFRNISETKRGFFTQFAFAEHLIFYFCESVQNLDALYTFVVKRYNKVIFFKRIRVKTHISWSVKKF